MQPCQVILDSLSQLVMMGNGPTCKLPVSSIQSNPNVHPFKADNKNM